MKNKYYFNDVFLTNFFSLIIPITNKLSNNSIAKMIKFVKTFSKRKDELEFLSTLLYENHKSVGTMREIIKNMSFKQRKAFLRAFVVNVFMIGASQRKKYEEKTNIHPLDSIIISPTMKCNLRCKYCCSGTYDIKEEMDSKLFNRILSEAKEMGTHACMVLGGEPFLKKDLLEVFEKNKDMGFVVYSNGTLFNGKIAKKCAELGNVIIAFSLEGLEKTTDKRRGKGIYKKVLKAMNIAKKYNLFYGYAVTITKDNLNEVTGEKFIDKMVSKGCKIGWHFPYVPVGRQPSLKRMLTPNQKIKLAKRVVELRENKEILIYDILQNPLFEGGCKAGGAGHIHIISDGKVEPCILVHFYVDNIKNKSLAEVLSSKFFKAIRNRPKDKDGIRPCLVLGNPSIFEKIVKKNCAKTTCTNSSCLFSKKISSDIIKHSKEYETKRLNYMKKKYMNFNEIK